MDAWIDRTAAALGDEPLTAEETALLLAVARDVAHRVERKVTPLATFLLGAAAARDVGAGRRRSEAVAAAAGRLRSLLPEDPEGTDRPGR